MIKQVQQEMVAWQQHNFPDRPAWQPLLGMGEELGELNHAFLKRAQSIRNQKDHAAAIKDACADLIIFMCDFANSQDFDLEQALKETWDVVKYRDWQANPDDANIVAESK